MNQQQNESKQLSQEGIDKLRFFLNQCEQIITQLRLDINEIKDELKIMQEEHQSSELINETQLKLNQLETNCSTVEKQYNNLLYLQSKNTDTQQ